MISMFYFQLLESFDWDTCFFNTSFIKEYECKDMAASTTLEIMSLNVAHDWCRWNNNPKYVPSTYLNVKTSFDLVKIYFLQYLYSLDMTTTKIKTMSILYDFESDVNFYGIR